MRVAGSNRDDTWGRIRTAGVDLLYRHGYEAMNTRQLAEAAGLKPGSLYYYFKSKEEFLHRLLVDLLEEILADLDATLAEVKGGLAVKQLDAFVRTLVKWHVQRREETFIASIEIRSLSQDRHESYIELRDRFDSTLRDILLRGIADGEFSLSREIVVRNALLTALTAISGWYDPRGQLGVDAISDEFVLLARRMVGAPGPVDAPARRASLSNGGNESADGAPRSRGKSRR
ncbi:TetR/AcrR family transcriptional regulator [Pseudonocardia sp. RS010]|uniref:TetR/AcrR family transcriptional regulator n=1 Tax=Pseudonocardia sp. RS010 TaxID=3385979 RepID=UPI0039A07457